MLEMSEIYDTPAGTTTKILVNSKDIPYCWKCGQFHFFIDCKHQDSASNEVGLMGRR